MKLRAKRKQFWFAWHIVSRKGYEIKRWGMARINKESK